jgi:undecaprenyl-diphosphatase
MTWWEALLLGLVQGLTEFLPVSSSGHLVLGQYLLGVQEPGITFEVMTHLGTTLSIITVYWARLGVIVRDGLRGIRQPGLWKEAFRPGPIERRLEDDSAGHRDRSTDVVPALRLILLIPVTMFATGLIYIFLGDWIRAAFGDPRFAAGMLLVTGTLLLLLLLRRNPDGRLSLPKALLIGLAQGAAMIPGISRSGSTICTAIYLNVERKQAADFSFLMLLPVIIAATLLEFREMVGAPETVNWAPILLGTVASYVAGVWAIKLVLDFVQRGNLFYFAFYCYAVGILGLIFIRP